MGKCLAFVMLALVFAVIIGGICFGYLSGLAFEGPLISLQQENWFEVGSESRSSLLAFLARDDVRRRFAPPPVAVRARCQAPHVIWSVATKRYLWQMEAWHSMIRSTTGGPYALTIALDCETEEFCKHMSNSTILCHAISPCSALKDSGRKSKRSAGGLITVFQHGILKTIADAGYVQLKLDRDVFLFRDLWDEVYGSENDRDASAAQPLSKNQSHFVLRPQVPPLTPTDDWNFTTYLSARDKEELGFRNDDETRAFLNLEWADSNLQGPNSQMDIIASSQLDVREINFGFIFVRPSAASKEVLSNIQSCVSAVWNGKARGRALEIVIAHYWCCGWIQKDPTAIRLGWGPENGYRRSGYRGKIKYPLGHTQDQKFFDLGLGNSANAYLRGPRECDLTSKIATMTIRNLTFHWRRLDYRLFATIGDIASRLSGTRFAIPPHSRPMLGVHTFGGWMKNHRICWLVYNQSGSAGGPQDFVDILWHNMTAAQHWCDQCIPETTFADVRMTGRLPFCHHPHSI